MPLWTQAKGAYKAVVGSNIATQWREWGKFAWAIPFAAADIAVSEDKSSAIVANVADIGVALAFRGKKGILPFILPPVAYAVARGGTSISGAHKTFFGKSDQVVQESNQTVTESNKPVIPIKGHDDGRWGRETTFKGGDFKPGSSWKGLNQEEAIGVFGELKGALSEYGVTTGTGHKRILIPRGLLSQQDIEEDLGFTPVTIAIPESGQTTKTSWRHTKNLYHIHQHEKFWTMHKDRHAAATMTAKAEAMQSESGEIGAFRFAGHMFAGLPHVVTEGIPGAYYYLKGKIMGGPTLSQRIVKETSPGYVSLIERLEKEAGAPNTFTKAIQTVRANLALTPIKGHDAGHWGREQIFADGDFEPGSSYKGAGRAVLGWMRDLSMGTRLGASNLAATWKQIGIGVAAKSGRPGIALATRIERTRYFTPHVEEALLEEARRAAIISKESKTLGEFQKQMHVESITTKEDLFKLFPERSGTEIAEWFKGLEHGGGFTVSTAQGSIPISASEKLLRTGPMAIHFKTPESTKNMLEFARGTTFHEHTERALEMMWPQYMKSSLYLETARHYGMGVHFAEAAFRGAKGQSYQEMALYMHGKGLASARLEVERGWKAGQRLFANRPRVSIKGHDAGRWGRETTFASGDFEPGSSWKGLRSFLGTFMGKQAAHQFVATAKPEMIFKKTAELFTQKVGGKFIEAAKGQGTFALGVRGGEITPLLSIKMPQKEIREAFKTGRFTKESYVAMRRGMHEMMESHEMLSAFFGRDQSLLRQYYLGSFAKRKQLIQRVLPSTDLKEISKFMKETQKVTKSFGSHMSKVPVEVELAFAKRAGILKETIAYRTAELQAYDKFAGAAKAQRRYIEEMPMILESYASKAKKAGVARTQRLNKLQEVAQPLPFELNAKRRTSHGVERPKRRR